MNLSSKLRFLKLTTTCFDQFDQFPKHFSGIFLCFGVGTFKGAYIKYVGGGPGGFYNFSKKFS